MTVDFGDEREALVRVLRLWTERRSRGTSDAEKTLTNGLRRMKIADGWGLSRIEKAGLPVEMDATKEGFIFGPAVTERGATFQPVASVFLKEEHDHVHVCLRLATYYIDRHGNLAADGWRFETGEVTPNSPHPWPHVQRTTRWHKEDQSLLDPLLSNGDSDDSPDVDTEPSVNESRPAIPLGCRTPAGLALTMVASLHGHAFVQDLVASDMKLRRAVQGPDTAALLLQA